MRENVCDPKLLAVLLSLIYQLYLITNILLMPIKIYYLGILIKQS